MAHLWQQVRSRLGARRLGGPPAPANGVGATDPVLLLAKARDLLDRAGQPGELPGSVNPLLALCGVAGGVLAYALGAGARALGVGYGGDLAVGLPVLALVVTLLGPLVGLVPARVLADRRHAVLGPRPITVVLGAGLLTTVLLLVARPLTPDEPLIPVRTSPEEGSEPRSWFRDSPCPTPACDVATESPSVGAHGRLGPSGVIRVAAVWRGC